MTNNNLSFEKNTEGIDFRKYLALFLYKGWITVLTAIIFGLTSYFISINLPSIYRSSTSVLVNEAPATKGADYSSVLMSKQLTSTYSQMMTNDLVLKQVSESVGLTNSLEEVKDWIIVSPVRDTQLIRVDVETSNADYSAKIANAIVSAFSEQIREIQTQRFAQSKSTLENQLLQTEKEIATFVDQAQLASTDEEKDRLESKVTQFRTIYSNLLMSYEQIRLSEAEAVSSVVQVEPAVPNPIPVKPNIPLNIILGTFLGIIGSASIIIAKDAMDDTIKTPDDITRRFGVPVLGIIYHSATKSKNLITIEEPRSPVAEAYRTLRTNISYTGVDHPIRKIMVTSPEPGDGKTTTLCNLAIVLAQAGKRVILADCDLRRPRVHTYFKFPNRQGMTTLFSHPEVLPTVIRTTPIDGLSVITSGTLPPNPSELMGSQKMQSIIQMMVDSSDIVLIDTPPALTVADAGALAPSLDGMLLVIKPGVTRVAALKQTLEQLNQVNARVLGIVINDVNVRGNPYYYRYNHYHNYKSSEDYYAAKE